ncbi:MAG: metalloprotease TldD [Acidobacteria bacterium]|nr:metalloprotease TldD [Acidobacteriota bacterium]
MIPPRPFDHLTESDLAKVLEAARESGADFAEIFLERTSERSMRREDGALRGATASLQAGAGIRAVSGEGTGYAYVCQPDLAGMIAAARRAGRISGRGGGGEAVLSPLALRREGGSLAAPGASIEPQAADIATRSALLEEIDLLARRSDPRVSEVSCSIHEEGRSILVANSDGVRAADQQILSGVSATVYVRAGGRTERGSAGGGGREHLETLVAGRLAPEAVAAEAVRRAVVLLDAVEAPTGEWPVVVGNGWGGVLLHEAVGHGFEADFVRRGTSVYTGRMGLKVASPLCTVVDDARVAGRRGSYRIDDEGTPSQRTPLIEKGILVGYLHDLVSARALGRAPTGNGRRHSFRTPPIPRQSNIFLEAGGDSAAEILRSVRRGLYAKNLGGGQVDIVNGNFVFQVTEGYLIEDGRVTAPVIGASLIGVGHEALSRVTRVGADFEFDPGVGTCGKDGQSQPVGVGQPTVLVSAMTVGGTRL